MALEFQLLFIHFGIQRSEWSVQSLILLYAARHFLLYPILIKIVHTEIGKLHF